MDQEHLFSKEYDAVMIAYSVLKRLKSGNVDSFPERLKCQKLQYFAQLFGVSPTYHFNLYLRGPYSPELAHDLYTIRDKHIKVDTCSFTPQELERRFDAFKSFLQGKTIKQLELAATLHWLINVANLPESTAKNKLATIKTASQDEVENTSNILREYAIKAV